MKRVFEARGIDRAVLLIISMLHILGGAYLSSPLYISQAGALVSKPNLVQILGHDDLAKIFGGLLLSHGIVLMYVATRDTINARMLSNTLWVGLLLRLYALTGTLVVTGSLLPPDYLAQIGITAILSGYILWVKWHARFIK